MNTNQKGMFQGKTSNSGYNWQQTSPAANNHKTIKYMRLLFSGIGQQRTQYFNPGRRKTQGVNSMIALVKVPLLARSPGQLQTSSQHPGESFWTAALYVGVYSKHSSPAETGKPRAESGAFEAPGIRRAGPQKGELHGEGGNRSVSGCTQGIYGWAGVQTETVCN